MNARKERQALPKRLRVPGGRRLVSTAFTLMLIGCQASQPSTSGSDSSGAQLNDVEFTCEDIEMALCHEIAAVAESNYPAGLIPTDVNVGPPICARETCKPTTASDLGAGVTVQFASGEFLRYNCERRGVAYGFICAQIADQ
jgi:hypothetical protein